jgi:hypothetical protein
MVVGRPTAACAAEGPRVALVDIGDKPDLTHASPANAPRIG